MKIYIKSAVSIENLKTQFAPEMEDTLFRQLIELDPTANYESNKGGKYCPWIFRQYNKGNLLEDEYVNVKDALGYFSQHYKKYPKSDLGQYKSVEEFLSDTEDVGNRELTDKEKAKLLKKQAHRASDEDKKFLVDDGPWEVWQPLTYPGSVSLARTGGTKATWCTAYEGDDYYWRSYTRRGPLYIFINTANPNEKYQLHFESNSWYDINDRSQGMAAFYQFCTEHPEIGEFFEIKTENGVQTRAGSVIGFDKTATEIIIPEGIVNIPSDFPDSVIKIVLPDSIQSLPSNVFSNLGKLTSIQLPANIKEIPARAFLNCTSLESIDIPNSVITYGEAAFEGCTELSNIKHSTNVAVIGNKCFAHCYKLMEDLPNSVTTLGANIFDGVTVTSLQIPIAVNKLGKSVFRGSKISNVDLSNTTIIGANAFRDSTVSAINLDNVIQIGSNAFRGCNNLSAINFNPSGVAVGPYAFADNSAECTVTIYPTTALNVSVFDDCPNMTIEWGAEDSDYEFYNIKCLIVDEKKCPKLVKANIGYVLIQTADGKTYEVED